MLGIVLEFMFNPSCCMRLKAPKTSSENPALPNAEIIEFQTTTSLFIVVRNNDRPQPTRYKLVAIKIAIPSKEFAQKHYHDLKERPFFNGLCDFLSSGRVWEGEGVIKYRRKLIGATYPQKSEPGTIRGGLTIVVGRCLMRPHQVEYRVDVLVIHLGTLLLGTSLQNANLSTVVELSVRPEPIISFITQHCVCGVNVTSNLE
ncbi:hypothetical protein ACLOJK_031981 [Asimina triloba]